LNQKISVDNYKEYTSNYFSSFSRIAIMSRISAKSLQNFPSNLPKELKEKINADFKFILDRRKLQKKGFLTKEDFNEFTKDYDPFTKFSFFLVLLEYYSLDAIFKLREANFDENTLLDLPVKQAFRLSFLEKHNIQDRDLTLKDFSAKYGKPNVLTIDFNHPKDAQDNYVDVINFNQQLLSQLLVLLLAQFESFLAQTIQIFTKNTNEFSIVKSKDKGKRYLIPVEDSAKNSSKIIIPNLKHLSLNSLFKFVTSDQVNLMSKAKKERKDFLLEAWRIRNLVVHNGGYITSHFLKQYPNNSQKVGQLLKINSDFISKLFSTIWYSSLLIYHNLSNKIE